MAKLHYLTVQDILWINLQTTKKVQHFSYARLEEATFYQYAYGDSNDLLSQAARFLSGFVKMRPLEAGNEATAFVALATFLTLNGACFHLADADALAWFRAASVSTEAARDALASLVEVDEHDHGHKPDVRGAIQTVIARYPSMITAFAPTTV